MKQMWLGAQNVAGLTARLEYFSRLMKGTPYKLGPMGESYLDSIENKPLVYMDSVDCVTYLEHVLAMALSPNENEIFNTLQKIRYKGGKIGYVNRPLFVPVIFRFLLCRLITENFACRVPKALPIECSWCLPWPKVLPVCTTC